MRLERSLAEMQATARKASRGFGVPWGLADEAGWAVRTLCAIGVDGCAALLANIDNTSQIGPEGTAPLTLTDTWQAAPGPICPITAGIALADSPHLGAARPLALDRVVAAPILIPFAMRAATQAKAPVTLHLGAACLVTNGTHVSGDVAELSLKPVPVSFSPGGEITTPCPLHTRARPLAADWARLEALAANTYAPDTEESRLRGAGAGLSDND